MNGFVGVLHALASLGIIGLLLLGLPLLAAEYYGLLLCCKKPTISLYADELGNPRAFLLITVWISAVLTAIGYVSALYMIHRASSISSGAEVSGILGQILLLLIGAVAVSFVNLLLCFALLQVFGRMGALLEDKLTQRLSKVCAIAIFIQIGMNLSKFVHTQGIADLISSGAELLYWVCLLIVMLRIWRALGRVPSIAA